MQQQPEEARNGGLEPPESPVTDAEQLKQALNEESRKAEEYLANWQRSQADFVNYKRRSQQEREDFSRFANATLILSLLPAIDDLERAFAAIPPELDGLPWTEGVKLIERKLMAGLQAQGLKPVKALGEPFDPQFHEAAKHDAGEEGVVVGELLKGYMLNDRLLRPAQVIVGNGAGAEEKEA